MGIAYAHITAPHPCDYMGYVRHLGTLRGAEIRQSVGVRRVFQWDLR